MDNEFNITQMIGRATIIYGPSGSGKTTLIIDILSKLRMFIPIVYIVSGTESANNNYGSIVNSAFILEKIDQVPQLILKLWEQQQKKTVLYNIISDFNNLKVLCRMLANDQKKQLNQQVQQAGNDMTVTIQIYKKFIYRNKDIIKKQINEQYQEVNDRKLYKLIIKNIKLNPKFLLIFDDCIGQGTKELNKALQRIFYEGRHVNLTTILATQRAMEIQKGLRENAFISMFCNSQVAEQVIQKLVTSTTLKQLITFIQLIAKNGIQNKIILCHSDFSINYYECKKIKHKFKFGNEQFQSICNQLDIIQKQKQKQDIYNVINKI